MKRYLAVLALASSCMTGDPPQDQKAGADLSADDKDPPGESAYACDTGPTTLGVDVSYYEGTIDWAKAHANGVEFAFVRVSDGLTFHDPKFVTNWNGAKAAGVIRGAYQFFRPTDDPTAQADVVIAALGGKYTTGDLPPVIDVEVTGGLGPTALQKKIRTWVDRVQTKLGVAPIIYTGTYFWRDQVGGPLSFANNPMWLARYTSCPAVTAPWTTWTFWQYTDSGHVPGIPGAIDMNRFAGTVDQLLAFAGGAVSTGTTTCMSETLNHDVPEGTCVQSDSDAQWYQCEGGSWVERAGSSGCGSAYAYCQSATLGKAVPPRTCVQSASDDHWYQCDGHGWVAPVDANSFTGPAGLCAKTYPR